MNKQDWDKARSDLWVNRFLFFSGTTEDRGKYADECVAEWEKRFPTPPAFYLMNNQLQT